MREVTLADGTKHEALVAYSLGNFNSAMTDEYTDSGIILEFTLVEQGSGRLCRGKYRLRAHLLLGKGRRLYHHSRPRLLRRGPEGMSAEQHQRLRKSVDDVTALMGGRLAVLRNKAAPRDAPLRRGVPFPRVNFLFFTFQRLTPFSQVLYLWKYHQKWRPCYGDHPEGLTFDDVLLIPRKSNVLPKE